MYPTPDYQKAAVDNYFEAHDPGYAYYSRLALDTGNITQLLDIDSLVGNSSGRYNRLGRGYPDVSALGINAAVSNQYDDFDDGADLRGVANSCRQIYSRPRNQHEYANLRCHHQSDQ